MLKTIAILFALFVVLHPMSAQAARDFQICPPYPQHCTLTAQASSSSQTTSETPAQTQTTNLSTSTQTNKSPTLTEAQIQAIVALLQAFGADAVTVSQVETALRK